MNVNFGYYILKEDGTKKYTPLKYPTKEKILPNYWNGNRAKQTSKFDYYNFNTRLDNLERFARKAVQELKNDSLPLTPNSVRNKIDELDNRNVQVLNEKISLNEYIEKFIQDITTGKRLVPSGQHEGQRYKQSTIRNFKGFQVQLKEYQEVRHRNLDYDDIDLDFYDDYLQFFNNKNYSPNTIGRNVKNLKSIMRLAREDGFHNNVKIESKKFKILKVDVYNIYLTPEEVQVLYDLDLGETFSLTRDVFLVGCYTAQRFSDYSRIQKKYIRTLENGRKAIYLTQKKTGEQVIIPINPELDSILKKYDYTLPKTYEQKVNKEIKEIGIIAKIDEPITIESIKGGLKIEKTVPKYELIKTHTARRTACTNMLNAKMETHEIMKISGHKTEREFLNYIKINKEQNAKKLFDNSFFSGSNLKIVN